VTDGSSPVVDLGGLAPSLGKTCNRYLGGYRRAFEDAVRRGESGVSTAHAHARALDGLLSALYCAADAECRRQQLLSRRVQLAEPGAAGPLPDASIMPDELRAAIILFFSMLDEKLRRLYAGLEALKTGRGGDARIAELLGLDSTTVARGRRELLDQDVEVEHVRRSGAGRRSMEKKRRK